MEAGNSNRFKQWCTYVVERWCSADLGHADGDSARSMREERKGTATEKTRGGDHVAKFE